MFLHNGKEYYPLELMAVKSRKKTFIYDREARNKPYIYLALENSENEGEE